jgi:hypothetical protein
MYFTPDWGAARDSVRHLADYAPTAVVTGHGPPMRGPSLQSELRQLASHFDTRARPAHGRYRDRPAITDANGVVDIPPPQVSARTVVLTGLAVGATIGLAVAARRRADERALSALAPADDVSLTRGAELAAADGGYDGSAAEGVAGSPASASAPPSYVDLR